MATAASEPKVEHPENRSDLNSTLPTAVAAGSAALLPESSGGSSVESEDKSEAPPIRAVDGDTVTYIQKKMKRAERFGVPVQLSEIEKRNSRAQRFGTGSPVNAVDSSETSEELKKKARAERFGIVRSETSDDVAKKKARIARFGPLSNTDPVEEDKKKARAIRFSQPVSGLNANGKGKIEVKAANPPKPGGGGT